MGYETPKIDTWNQNPGSTKEININNNNNNTIILKVIIQPFNDISQGGSVLVVLVYSWWLQRKLDFFSGGARSKIRLFALLLVLIYFADAVTPLDMSQDHGEFTTSTPNGSGSDETKVRVAAGVVAAAEGRMKIPEAMKLAGFSTPETKQPTIYQRVRRRSQRVVVEERKGASTTSSSSLPSAVAVPAAAAARSAGSSLSGSSVVAGAVGRTGTTRSSSAAAAVAPSASVRRRFTIGEGGGEEEEDGDKKPAAEPVKKRRRTSSEKQRDNAVVVMLKNKDKRAMKSATVKIAHNNQLPKGHPSKKSARQIVEETNINFDSNISYKTAMKMHSK